MLNFIKTILINNDPLILTIVFFSITAKISTTVTLGRTLAKKNKKKYDKIYILTLILIATILMTTILITTYIK